MLHYSQLYLDNFEYSRVSLVVRLWGERWNAVGTMGGWETSTLDDFGPVSAQTTLRTLDLDNFEVSDMGNTVV